MGGCGRDHGGARTCRWPRWWPMPPTPSCSNPIANRMRESRLPAAAARGRGSWSRPPRLRARTRLLARRSSASARSPRAGCCSSRRGRIGWSAGRQAVRLYEAAGEPKELCVVDGAGHGEAHATGAARHTSAGSWTSSSGTWTGRRPYNRARSTAPVRSDTPLDIPRRLGSLHGCHQGPGRRRRPEHPARPGLHPQAGGVRGARRLRRPGRRGDGGEQRSRT